MGGGSKDPKNLADVINGCSPVGRSVELCINFYQKLFHDCAESWHRPPFAGAESSNNDNGSASLPSLSARISPALLTIRRRWIDVYCPPSQIGATTTPTLSPSAQFLDCWSVRTPHQGKLGGRHSGIRSSVFVQ